MGGLFLQILTSFCLISHHMITYWIYTPIQLHCRLCFWKRNEISEILLTLVLNYNQSEPLNRNGSGGFGALKSDSTHHFFRNACSKSGSLRFSQFSGCWLILSVYIIMSFDFPFVRSSVILLLPLLKKTNVYGLCRHVLNLPCSIDLEPHDTCIPYPYIDTLCHRTSRDILCLWMIF